MRHTITGHRLAIRVDADTLLAVPPMRPDLPREVRVKVFEYVLRGQLGLAETVAQIEADVIDGRERHDRRAAQILGSRVVYLGDDYGVAA